MAIDHNQIWQDSIATLSQLIRQRRKLDKAIARLEQMISWGPLSGSAKPQQPSNPKSGRIGFTEAVRLVFSTYRIWLSPVLVRDLLPSVGFKTDPYKHPCTYDSRDPQASGFERRIDSVQAVIWDHRVLLGQRSCRNQK
jgi:hypothetical protein